MWIAPPYIGFGGWWQWLFNIAGGLLIAIAFCGAGLELGKIWKNQAFEYWGVGLVFLVPAVLLHFAAWWSELSSPWMAITKSIALGLDAVGGTFVLLGASHLFGRLPYDEQPYEPSPEEKEAARQRRREVAVATWLLLLTAVTAALKTVFGIG